MGIDKSLIEKSMMETLSQPTKIYQISELNAEVAAVLQGRFHDVWVQGEVSNLSQPASGHCYFSLKDQNAQVRCALFRLQKSQLNFKIENGTEVIALAKVALYAVRGDYQLIIEKIQLAGIGKLQLEFVALKQKLHQAGLFAEIHKKPLPKFPRQIGVITSPTGAAIRDVLSVLKRRFSSIPIIIYPTAVQGATASNEIARAIQTANRRQECDVLLLVRGGGSLEDLWSFNEEQVAQAIFASQLPIVTGIGHAIDISIADFTADFAAPTPSVAAEKASPEADQLSQQIKQLSNQLYHIMRNYLSQAKLHLQDVSQLLQHPKEKIQQKMQYLDYLNLQLVNLIENKIRNQRTDLQQRISQLLQFNPQNKLQTNQLSNIQLHKNLITAWQYLKKDKQQQLAHLAQRLNQLNPLKILENGYSLVKSEGQLIRDTKQLKPADLLEIKFHRGIAIAKVIKVND